MKLLAFAYACEPAEGSEPGAGWMWARMLARYGDAWVLTRSNNRERIESELGAIPERDALHFVYVDLPPWGRSWKRGTRGLRSYYLLWQVAALLEARRLHRSESFDLVWHLTLANAWLGSLAPLVGPPFVYGPVGGGVAPPWRLVPSMGIRPTLYEAARGLGRGSGRYLNPLARLAWRRARSILVQNPETVGWLPRQHRDKARVFPNLVLSSPPVTARTSGDHSHTALFAGRLLAWKGVDLAIGAIAMLPEWRLVICGRGPDEARLRRLAADAGALDRTEFKGWVTHEHVLRLMRDDASVFLFPSLHDEAGWVVVEALAAGLPVVCLDHGGPGFLADGHGIGIGVHGGRRALMSRLAAAVETARNLPMTGARDAVRKYEIDRRSERLGEIVNLLAAS